MEYRLLQAGSISDLIKKIKEMLTEGWKPYGSPTVAPQSINPLNDRKWIIRSIYLQPMVKGK